MVSVNDIKKDVDKVLADKSSVKKVVNDSELAVEVLKSKGVYELEVEVDGKPVFLVRSPERPPEWDRFLRGGLKSSDVIKKSS